MPLHEFHCLNGHSTEAFVHHADDKGARTMICETCGHTMGPVVSFGTARQLYFEEGRTRRIMHLGHEPVYVSSEKQHRELMKKEKVELAGQHRGQKGWWL